MCCMKILDFRKYFFSYLYIIFSLLLFIAYWSYNAANYPSVNENEFISEGTFHFIVVGYIFTAYLAITGLLVLEIIIRKFIVEKFFPSLEFPIKITLPKILNKILSVIFYILFAIASVPILFSLYVIILIQFK